MRTLNRMVAVAAAGLLTMGLAACNGAGGGNTEAPTEREGKLSIYTSCFPVDWLTRQVAGDHADVTNILPAGEDPPEWTPPAEVVSGMQKADLVVINGASFEGWVATTTLPQDKIVDTTAGKRDQLIVVEEAGTHSHGKEGEHSHRGTDPHTWSDPAMATAQAEVIRDALIAADPANTATYESNCKALAEELGALDVAYKGAMASYNQEVMATSHPAFNYLARTYGLKLINFGFEPDSVPDEAALHDLEHAIAEDQLTVILWEAHPTDEVKAKFDELGLMSVFLDPLEQPGEGAAYDYLAQSRQNVAALQGLFGGEVQPVEGTEEEAPAEAAPAEAAPTE